MVIAESETNEHKSSVIGEQVRAQMLVPNCLGFILCHSRCVTLGKFFAFHCPVGKMRVILPYWVVVRLQS